MTAYLQFRTSRLNYLFLNDPDDVNTGRLEGAAAAAYPTTPPSSTLTIDGGTPRFADMLIAYATIPGGFPISNCPRLFQAFIF